MTFSKLFTDLYQRKELCGKKGFKKNTQQQKPVNIDATDKEFTPGRFRR